ncbi:MAG: efflux transporter periplasmic adaptor subunit [Gammaproteobacteria bacterium RBG_16_57_12]|nr:MAG: efflux transporter periplasmic adaptor subunit [Gammaproteobacteria bacterium RBG_16_57_12]
MKQGLAALLLWPAGVLAQPPLATAPVSYQPLAQEQVFDAVIEAVKQATVSAQTSGRVVEINYDVDDYVPKGSVILRFEDVEQQANLSAAEAALREQQARYDEASAEHQRIKDIFEKKLVAKAEYDRAVTGLRTAKERLEAAQAHVLKAKEQVNYTLVKAPYSGIVVKRHVEVGEMARVGQALMSGFSLQELRATTRVPQRLVDAIRRHNRARMLFDGQTAVPADRMTIYPYADPDTHTFQVRVQLKAGQEGIYPGMLVKLAFVTGEERRLVLPQQAIAQRSEVSAVYVVAPDGRLAFRQVRLGSRLPDDMIEILSGVTDGERIALDPVAAAIALKQQREPQD